MARARARPVGAGDRRRGVLERWRRGVRSRRRGDLPGDLRCDPRALRDRRPARRVRRVDVSPRRATGRRGRSAQQRRKRHRMAPARVPDGGPRRTLARLARRGRDHRAPTPRGRPEPDVERCRAGRDRGARARERTRGDLPRDAGRCRLSRGAPVDRGRPRASRDRARHRDRRDAPAAPVAHAALRGRARPAARHERRRRGLRARRRARGARADRHDPRSPCGPFAARPYLPSASRRAHTPGRRHGASAKAGGGAGRTLYLERAGGSVEAVVIAVVVVAVVLFFVSTYNRLVTLRQRVKEAWADIDVQLKRRHDLIPNLVETVKGYATHESTVFQNVTQARAAAVAAGATASPQERAQAENVLTGALRSVFAVAENYPQLQAVQEFKDLSENLTATEDKIAFARRFYNGNVRDYNTSLQTFPTNLFADAFGFKPEEYFELAEAGEREAPQVKF